METNQKPIESRKLLMQQKAKEEREKMIKQAKESQSTGLPKFLSLINSLQKLHEKSQKNQAAILPTISEEDTILEEQFATLIEDSNDYIEEMLDMLNGSQDYYNYQAITFKEQPKYGFQGNKLNGLIGAIGNLQKSFQIMKEKPKQEKSQKEEKSKEENLKKEDQKEILLELFCIPEENINSKDLNLGSINIPFVYSNDMIGWQLIPPTTNLIFKEIVYEHLIMEDDILVFKYFNLLINQISIINYTCEIKFTIDTGRKQFMKKMVLEGEENNYYLHQKYYPELPKSYKYANFYFKRNQVFVTHPEKDIRDQSYRIWIGMKKDEELLIKDQMKISVGNCTIQKEGDKKKRDLQILEFKEL